jgi:hypothetical protein
MILAVFECRAGEALPEWLPASLVRLIDEVPRAVIVLSRGDLLPASSAPALHRLEPGDGSFETMRSTIAAAPPGSIPVVDLRDVPPEGVVGLLHRAGDCWRRTMTQPPAFLAACQKTDLDAAAVALADAFLVPATALDAAGRARVLGRIRRRAMLLRWMGPAPLLRTLAALLRRLNPPLRQ